jgi:hypothetical protein
MLQKKGFRAHSPRDKDFSLSLDIDAYFLMWRKYSAREGGWKLLGTYEVWMPLFSNRRNMSQDTKVELEG